MLLASIVVLGSIYALLGAGFVIIYRSSRILNFAHAEVVMLAAYISISIASVVTNSILALFSVLICCFFLGIIVYSILIRPLAGYSVLSPIIITVALGVVINAVAILGWKGNMEVIPFRLRGIIVFPGGIRMSYAEVTTIILVGVFFIATGLFYRFAKSGQQMRATAERALLAAQRGVKIYMISGFAWGIAFIAAGMAGVLLGINYTVNLQMGTMAVAAFVVALVGGLDSFWGTIPAALLIATTERLTITYINPRLAETIPFVILLIVLIFKPWGLFGTKEELERV